MKAPEFAARIARIYRVHVPQGSSYKDLLRLRTTLWQRKKSKEVLEKQSSFPAFNPPTCEEPFRVEEETKENVQPTTQPICPVSMTPRTEAFMKSLSPIADIQTPRVLAYSECPLSDEGESPKIGSKRVLSW